MAGYGSGMAATLSAIGPLKSIVFSVQAGNSHPTLGQAERADQAMAKIRACAVRFIGKSSRMRFATDLWQAVAPRL
jgi:hypothetical protein